MFAEALRGFLVPWGEAVFTPPGSSVGRLVARIGVVRLGTPRRAVRSRGDAFHERGWSLPTFVVSHWGRIKRCKRARCAEQPTEREFPLKPIRLTFWSESEPGAVRTSRMNCRPSSTCFVSSPRQCAKYDRTF